MNSHHFQSVLSLALFVTLLCGCSAVKEPTEEQKEQLRTKIEQTKVGVVDPIYDVSEASCSYNRKHGRWPAVEFVSTPESRFESFVPVPRNNKILDATFRLKSSPANWILVLELAGEDRASAKCLLTLLSPGPTNTSNLKNGEIPRGTVKPFSDRVIAGTQEDRYQMVMPLMFATSMAKIQTFKPSPEERIAEAVAVGTFHAGLCGALGIKTERCR